MRPPSAALDAEGAAATVEKNPNAPPPLSIVARAGPLTASAPAKRGGGGAETSTTTEEAQPQPPETATTSPKENTAGSSTTTTITSITAAASSTITAAASAAASAAKPHAAAAQRYLNQTLNTTADHGRAVALILLERGQAGYRDLQVWVQEVLRAVLSSLRWRVAATIATLRRSIPLLTTNLKSWPREALTFLTNIIKSFLRSNLYKSVANLVAQLVSVHVSAARLPLAPPLPAPADGSTQPQQPIGRDARIITALSLLFGAVRMRSVTLLHVGVPPALLRGNGSTAALQRRLGLLPLPVPLASSDSSASLLLPPLPPALPALPEEEEEGERGEEEDEAHDGAQAAPPPKTTTTRRSAAPPPRELARRLLESLAAAEARAAAEAQQQQQQQAKDEDGLPLPPPEAAAAAAPPTTLPPQSSSLRTTDRALIGSADLRAAIIRFLREQHEGLEGVEEEVEGLEVGAEPVPVSSSSPPNLSANCSSVRRSRDMFEAAIVAAGTSSGGGNSNSSTTTGAMGPPRAPPPIARPARHGTSPVVSAPNSARGTGVRISSSISSSHDAAVNIAQADEGLRSLLAAAAAQWAGPPVAGAASSAGALRAPQAPSASTKQQSLSSPPAPPPAEGLLD